MIIKLNIYSLNPKSFQQKHEDVVSLGSHSQQDKISQKELRHISDLRIWIGDEIHDDLRKKFQRQDHVRTLRKTQRRSVSQPQLL